MTRYIVLGFVTIWLILVVCIYVAGYREISGLIHSPRVTEAKPRLDHVYSREMRALPDVDALALRLPQGQDTYEQVRDETLASYRKLHPNTAPTDEEAKETLRLASYLFVWGDYYGEGLWDILAQRTRHLREADGSSQIWITLNEVYWFTHRHYRSVNDEQVNRLNGSEETFSKTPYPAAFRFWACEASIQNMVAAKYDASLQPPVGNSLDALPLTTDRALACYREIVRQHPSHACLFALAANLLHLAEKDEATLEQINKGLDAIFNSEDPTNPLRQILDGEAVNVEAWSARGTGPADSVSAEDAKIFQDRLAQAESILTDAYNRTPQEPGTGLGMMDVVRGRGEKRDQMETWFQRGLQQIPGSFAMHEMKKTYLLPRWAGSDEALVQFGMECAKSTDWGHKTPIMLVECLRSRAGSDAVIYSQPDLWQTVDSVYRGYLGRYPDSVHYRSLYALDATRGGHWDIAKEQFRLLGENWDTEVFRGTLYERTRSEAFAH